MTLFLDKDLAEHMLREFASVVPSSSIVTDTWSAEEIASMKQSIITLMESCGDFSLSEKARSRSTLCEILEVYKTGTQMRKTWNRPN